METGNIGGLVKVHRVTSFLDFSQPKCVECLRVVSKVQLDRSGMCAFADNQSE